ncbi:MAG: putative quinol monooxygenase [Gaiellaceae bacterium]
MAEIYTTGNWTPKPGEEQAFVEAWTKFADWAHSMPGAGTLRLARDSEDATKFVSFGRWESADAAHTWKASPEFPERMGRVQQHVAEFRPAELEIVAEVRGAPVGA